MTNVNASTSSRLSALTPSKVCNACKTRKPLGHFHRKSESKDGFQGRCKACHKARQRDWVNSSAPSRQTIGEIQLSTEQREKMYIDVIRRMALTGIMSTTTANEALKRVMS